MDIVTALSVIECLGIIANRAETPLVVGLLQDSSRGVLGGINFKGVGTSRVGLLENGVTQHDCFEPLNGSCAGQGPNKRGVLFYEHCQRFGNVGKAMDEWSLVAKDTEGAANVFNSGKLFGPGGQTVAFHRIDANCTVTDYNA
jgi:hypothetical protein